MEHPLWIKIITIAVSGIAMTLVMGWISKSRLKERPESEQYLLVPPLLFLFIGLVGFLLFAGVPIGLHFFTDENIKPIQTGIFIGFSLMCLLLVFEYFLARHELFEDGIGYGGLTGKRGFIQWDDVHMVSYSASMKWFKVESVSGDVARISTYAIGIHNFASTLLAYAPHSVIASKAEEVLKATAAGNLPPLYDEAFYAIEGKYDQIIQQCADNLGEAPRHFKRNANKVEFPEWLNHYPEDELNTFFKKHDEILENGAVVWGYLVQANLEMFESGESDLPGDMVFSFESYEIMSPEYLSEVAGRVSSLKGIDPDDRLLQPIAEHLTDEYQRAYGFKIPMALSNSGQCYLSTVNFSRNHLPGGKITCSLIPLVISTSRPYVAVPLPSKYWPKDFVQWWSNYEY